MISSTTSPAHVLLVLWEKFARLMSTIASKTPVIIMALASIKLVDSNASAHLDSSAQDAKEILTSVSRILVQFQEPKIVCN